MIQNTQMLNAVYFSDVLDFSGKTKAERKADRKKECHRDGPFDNNPFDILSSGKKRWLYAKDSASDE